MTSGRKLDLVGKKVEMLEVLERLESDDKGTRFLVKCDCGTVKEIRGYQITRKNPQKSCGCLKYRTGKKNLSVRKDYGESNFNQLYQRYIHSAKKKGHTFSLDKEEFKRLTSSRCYYCGKPPEREQNKEFSYGPYLYNGLDRCHNSQGYETGNVVPCCWSCNQMKRDRDHNDFLNLIKIIYERCMEHENDKFEVPK